MVGWNWRRALRTVSAGVEARVRKHPASLKMARQGQRVLRSTALSPLLRRATQLASVPIRGQMRPKDVLRIAGTLEAASITYFIAGGWGIDALVGEQTRKHDDLDLVLRDFEQEEPRARQALAELGFRFVHSQAAGIWMPQQTLLDDGGGLRIELLSIDENRLLSGVGSGPWSTEPRNAAVDSIAFDTGEIAGRKVPCLSDVAQILFHSGYDVRTADERDLHLLRQKMGRSPAGQLRHGP